jgi:hypothetical protein
VRAGWGAGSRSRLLWRVGLATLALTPLVAWLRTVDRSDALEIRELKFGAFAFEQELVVPGTPEIAYNAMTGDVSGWWDHTFSESPEGLVLEANPGGRFYENFGAGQGAVHASVIYADRGKVLRFDGPLGLSGKALQMVHTFRFEPVGDSTRITLEVHAAGELEDGWAEAVESVWRHFLVERFQPYVEASGGGG